MRLLSIKNVARRLDVSEKTVRRWIADGKFPAPIVLPGNLHRWEAGEVTGWTLRNRTEPGPDAEVVKQKT